MRLAYADREKYLGDPDFVRVPVAGLGRPRLSRRALGADRPGPHHWRASRPAIRRARRRWSPGSSRPNAGTSHFVAVDRWGNVASQTSTIESAFGSGLMVNGYYLNNELTDFSFVPKVGVRPSPTGSRAASGRAAR